MRGRLSRPHVSFGGCCLEGLAWVEEVWWELGVDLCRDQGWCMLEGLLVVGWRAIVELANLHVYFGTDYRGQSKFSNYSRLDSISGEITNRGKAFRQWEEI